MFVEPRPPHRHYRVAGLQHGPHPRARAATYQAEMTAVAAGQEFDDGAGFAVAPDPENDAFVSPFHGLPFTLLCDKPQPARICRVGDLTKHFNMIRPSIQPWVRREGAFARPASAPN